MVGALNRTITIHFMIIIRFTHNLNNAIAPVANAAAAARRVSR